MQDYQSLCHSRWDRKCHVVFISIKCKKRIFGALRPHLGEIFRELASQKSQIVEGDLKGDHVHICISIPPTFEVSNVVRFFKGKALLRLHEILVGDRETSRVKYFGREALSRRLVWMKQWCGRTSVIRRMKINATTR
jgi:putative transposase